MTMTISGSGTITGITAGGLPDSTITQAELATGVASTGPAFSAYQTSATSLTQNTFVKVAFQAEEFDTNSNYDKDTNYRFTPTVSGYYQITGSVGLATQTATLIPSIYKNGTEFKRGNQSANQTCGNVTALIYFNGSTDYVELYAYQSAATQNTNTSAVLTSFQGAMVRAA